MINFSTRSHSPEVNNKSETIRFFKYACVGASNTVITFVTFTLLRHAGIGEDFSNAAGYVAGMVNSFCWNRQWVFQSREGNRLRQSAWFVTGALLCWLIQWGVFRGLLAMQLHESLAYLAGMAVYTLLNYFFNKRVTFRKKES